MDSRLKQQILRMHRGKPIAFKCKDYACLVGQRCDFYIYVQKAGRSYYSEWVKGKRACEIWDASLQFNGTAWLFDRLVEQYNAHMKQTA